MQRMLQESLDYIRSRTNFRPKLGVILGSGLGAFVNEVKVEARFGFDEIPHFAPTSVEGHKGNLILGTIDSTPVAVLQGRIHYYEGHSMHQVAFPTRVLAMLGIEVMLITNSAGGLDPNMSPGDFMLIEDHINLMGDNPLKGPNMKDLGPRFPDMTHAYDPHLRSLMSEILEQEKISAHKGIYCGVSGPTYETPAEVRYLQLIGGKAVGMSTVPEVIAANHLGLRVCALSCITNLAAGLSRRKLSHEEVTETAAAVEADFCRFIKAFIARI